MAIKWLCVCVFGGKRLSGLTVQPSSVSKKAVRGREFGWNYSISFFPLLWIKASIVSDWANSWPGPVLKHRNQVLCLVLGLGLGFVTMVLASK